MTQQFHSQVSTQENWYVHRKLVHKHSRQHSLFITVKCPSTDGGVGGCGVFIVWMSARVWKDSNIPDYLGAKKKQQGERQRQHVLWKSPQVINSLLVSWSQASWNIWWVFQILKSFMLLFPMTPSLENTSTPGSSNALALLSTYWEVERPWVSL
jgi:hypothetical protein